MTEKNSENLKQENAWLRQQVAGLEDRTKQLQSKLTYFNLLFETLARPIFIKDVNGIYIGCNKAFENFLGKRKDQIIGKSAKDMGPTEMAEKYRQKDKELMISGGVQQYEWTVAMPDSSRRDVIFNKALFHNDDQTIGGIIGVITDITHRARAEQAMRASEEKFKKISELANDAIIQMDEPGRIIFWNDAATQIFGYAPHEVMGRDLHQILVPHRHMKPFLTGFKRLKSSAGERPVGRTMELTALKKDGTEFKIELSMSSYENRGTWNTVGIVRDISRRKAREKEKEQMIRELQTALDEIKTLKGIVPICASCKKIRDDKGFWNDVETYVQKHSQAEFSHGICPECRQKLYPEFSGKKNK